MTSEYDEECCQICLLPKPQLVMPCGHKACQSCIERIFFATSPHHRSRNTGWDTDSDVDTNQELLEDRIVSSCPSRGRCPFCRRAMNLFELRTQKLKVQTKKGAAYAENTERDGDGNGGDDDQPNNEMIQSEIHLIGNHDESDHKSSSGTLLVPAFDCMTDFSKCPLAGLTFGDRSGKIAIAFPTNSGEKPSIKAALVHGGKNELHFNGDCYYHEKSKTFAGSLTWKLDGGTSIKNTGGSEQEANDENGRKESTTFNGDEDEGIRKCEVVMQFAADYRYVAHGAIIKHRSSTVSSTHRCPLDGKWTVRWQRASERGIDRNSLESAQLRIVDNSWTLYGRTYTLNFGGSSDESTCTNEQDGGVHFFWENSDGGVKQTAESGVDLIRKPDGPDVGETVVWTVNHPDYFRIFWTRETKGDSPPAQINCFGNAFGDTLLFRQNHIRQTSKPTYHPHSLWGNVFIQALQVGLASYHFISSDGEGENGAYISYENIACSHWPPLDDGSPVPSRVPFVNFNFDSDTRTFRGTIPWFEVYGTSWQGCNAWNYEIVFDSEFVCILSGGVKSVTADGGEGYDHSYGEVLNYMNADLKTIVISQSEADIDDSTERDHAADDSEEEGRIVVNEHEDSVGSSPNNQPGNMEENNSAGQDGIAPIMKRRYETLKKIRSRLLEEGATVRTLRLISSGSQGAFNEDRDPIDYNL